MGPCGEPGQWVMFRAVPRIGATGCVWSWRVCQRGGPHGGLSVESGQWAASGVARRAGAAAALGLRGGLGRPSANPTEFLRESGVDLTRVRCGSDADPARILRRFGAVSVPCEWRFCERSRGGGSFYFYLRLGNSALFLPKREIESGSAHPRTSKSSLIGITFSVRFSFPSV